MGNIRQLISLILLSYFISFPVIGEERGPKVRAMIAGSCNSVTAIKKIADLDKTDAGMARELFLFFTTKGMCGFYLPPILASLDKKDSTYIDSVGDNIDIWRIYNTNLWCLVSRRNIILIDNKKETEV